MQKLKKVLSHRDKDNASSSQAGHQDTPSAAHVDRPTSGGLTGEGSHFSGTKNTQAASEQHPIYDQFAKSGPPGATGATGGAVKANDHTSHIPTNTAGLSSNTTSGLHPDRPHTREDLSAASVKSGIIGFPPSAHDSHPALANNKALDQSNQAQPQPPAINVQNDHLDRPNTETAIQDSGRVFPLAGGVKNEKPAVSRKEVNPEHDHGRDGLATAAAAAAVSSTGHPNERGVAGAVTNTQTSNPTAVAAASKAAQEKDEHGWTHDHCGHGHTYCGDPCEANRGKADPKERGLLFTDGPHSTDTANMMDPKLHIPGAFPSPTPLEENNASSYMQSKPTNESSFAALAEPELRHTGSLDEPQARSAEPTSSHKGRDAAILGGVGAAGAGAYAAGKHHQKEPTNIGGNFPDEPNPYTSTPADPRMDTSPRNGFGEQRFDPAASGKSVGRNAPLTGGAKGPQAVADDSKHHYGRDAALVGGGAAAGAGLASQQKNRRSSGPASSTIGPHKSNIANVLDPRVKPDPELQKHHTAAETAQDPASSTIGPHKSNLANVMDPRVQPDPHKQKEAAAAMHENPGEQSHTGRNVAAAGGAGAAGYGAYEAAKNYGEHRSTQESAHMNEQRYDPTARGTHASAPHVADHHGRDTAAVGGPAAGAAGYGAIQPQPQPRFPQDTTKAHQRYDSMQEPPQNQDHSKRNAALGTAAVAGAGTGAAAYATHEHSPEAVKHQKDVVQKEAEQQRELDHEKQSQNQHVGFTEGQRRSSQESDGKGTEKKHRLFGFLHRDKKDKDKDSSPNDSPTRRSADSPRHSRDAGAAGIGAGAYEQYDSNGKHLGEKHGRNVLHKEPPKGHQGDHNTITEPHTGLPANVGKYGDGHGGTDGNEAIHGVHQHGHGVGREVVGEGRKTDWENIKEKDTIL